MGGKGKRNGSESSHDYTDIGKSAMGCFKLEISPLYVFQHFGKVWRKLENFFKNSHENEAFKLNSTADRHHTAPTLSLIRGQQFMAHKA